MDAHGSRYEPVTSPRKHGNESSGATKGGEFLDQLSDYKFFKKDPSP